MLGQTISHYRIDEQLGRGGMGVVYLATDLSLKRQVAIKFAGDSSGATPDPVLLTGEARAASRLTHPNIARIYELDQTAEGRPFFVMEYVPGRNLSEMVEDKPLETPRAVEVLRAVTQALAEAHAQGIVHRDIKPGNIRIGDDGVVKVLDFGLASRVRSAPGPESDVTVTQSYASGSGAVAGTLGYMSPEQSIGKPLDARSDLFSLGCVLYQCLTGHRPFTGKSLAENISEVHLLTPPAPSKLNPLVPKYLDEITAKLLAKEPAARFQTARDLLVALDAGGGKSGKGNAAFEFLVGHRRASMAAAGALALAAALIAVFHARPYQPKPEALRWYQDGLEAIRDGTYLKASKALSETVRIDPGFALARAHLAEAWYEMDYAGKAREEMIRALRAADAGGAPGRVDRLHMEAIDYLVTGDVKESIARYKQMLERAQSSQKAMVLVDLGRAYEQAGDFKSAAESYREAVSIDPLSAAAWLHLGQLYRRTRKYKEAEAAFASAERLYQVASNMEGVTEVQYGLGALRIDQERPEEAKKILEKALESARLNANTQQQVKLLLQLATLSVKNAATGEVRKLA